MKSCRRPADKPLINCGLCSSNGLHRNYLFRASEEMFRTVVFDALEGTRDGCVLREQTCRRLTLPGPPRPAAPPCAARLNPPDMCPGFGFDRSATLTVVPPSRCSHVAFTFGACRIRFSAWNVTGTPPQRSEGLKVFPATLSSGTGITLSPVGVSALSSSSSER